MPIVMWSTWVLLWKGKKSAFKPVDAELPNAYTQMAMNYLKF